MNSRQARRERREAERKAKKLELKKARVAGNSLTPQTGFESIAGEISDSESAVSVQEQPGLLRNDCPPSAAEELARPLPSPIGFVSQNRLDANRANSRLSTGPRTASGKLASSRNSTKHGLASGQLLIPGESPAAFDQLLNDLLKEHQPSTPSEDLLVKEMAQSYWLAQRAVRLQTTCFTENGVNEKELMLFLRYQTTHSRRFYKALESLVRLKKEAARNPRGFVSQHTEPVQPASDFVRQNAHSAGFVSQMEQAALYPQTEQPDLDPENQSHSPVLGSSETALDELPRRVLLSSSPLVRNSAA